MLTTFQHILDIMEHHLDLILTIAGILFAWYIYMKEEKDSTIKKLAKQVIAYYCLEKEAIKIIHDKTQESEQTIQRKLRSLAVDNEDNREAVRPELTAAGARKYL